MGELNLEKLVRVEHVDGAYYYDEDGNLRAEENDSYPQRLYREFDEDGDVTFASMGEIDPSVHSDSQITAAIDLIEMYLANAGAPHAGPLANLEVYEAAWHLDIDARDIKDKYVGEFYNNAEFAEGYAESTGTVDTTEWPCNCIDWDRAAADLLMNHSEWDGHYFRDN